MCWDIAGKTNKGFVPSVDPESSLLWQTEDEDVTVADTDSMISAVGGLTAVTCPVGSG